MIVEAESYKAVDQSMRACIDAQQGFTSFMRAVQQRLMSASNVGVIPDAARMAIMERYV